MSRLVGHYRDNGSWCRFSGDEATDATTCPLGCEGATLPGRLRHVPPRLLSKAISQTLSQALPGIHAHVDAVRASQTRSASDFGTPGRNTAQGNRRIDRDRAEQGSVVRPDSQTHVSNPRRMVAVTVALSEPLDAPELDWAGTIAANLRLFYSGTTVEIIDTWRTDA